MAIVREEITFSGEGHTFDAVVLWQDSIAAKRPGVLVQHAWGGRGDHEVAAAERLAALGYVAMAGDVYGDGQRGTTPEECTALMTPMMEDRQALQRRLRLNLDQIADHQMCTGDVAATGYCFGGLCALDLARANAPIKGAVAFHALLGNSADLGADAISPKIIALQGYDDPMAGPEDQDAFAKEMTARKADWQLHLYGGVAHSFTNTAANNPDMGLIYDARAARRAEAAMADFLAEVF